MLFMLEVENRYKPLQKHDRIRIENWVGCFGLILLYLIYRAKSFVR